MGYVYCPECGSKISDKARTCPYCGFRNAGKLIPISKMEIEEVNHSIQIANVPLFNNQYLPAYRDANRKLAEFFSNAKKVEKYAPEIYDFIKNKLNPDKQFVAQFSEKAKEMMDSGELVLNIDKKTGDYLPTIRNAESGKIFQQVRLKEIEFPQDLAPMLYNLRQQAMMQNIMDQLSTITESVEQLHVDMMDDRLSKAEAVWVSLQQATLIKDTQLRNQKLLAIQQTATESKINLQNNFKRNLERLTAPKAKAKTVGTAGNEAMIALSAISLLTRIECASYLMLGEEEAGAAVLDHYMGFVRENKLDSATTLILINEFSSYDRYDIVKEFREVTKTIKDFQLQHSEKKLLTGKE